MKSIKNRGITLIALVVTIIILIILATISIRMVIGEGGLLNQANLAKVEYRAAEVDEEVLAWKAEKEMAKYTTEIMPQKRDALIADQLTRGLLTQEEADTATEKGQVQIGSKTIHYGEDTPPTSKNEIAEQYGKKQTDEKTVYDNSEIPKSLTIPEGFTIVNPEEDDTIKYDDENNPKVDEGIVIKDEQDNEFVWVPIDDINNMAKLQEESQTNWEGKLYDFSIGQTAYDPEKNSEPAILSSKDDETNLNKIQPGLTSDNFKTQLQNEFNSMIKSVNKYKGFYIGRYETSGLDTDSPKVQAKQEPTTNIDWYTMYKNSKGVAKEGAKVTSSMIWGCQWDAIMNWFLNSNNKATKKYVTDSTGRGYYDQDKETGTKTITGSNSAYRVNNIYDMAGNVCEWTLEVALSINRVSRGGSYLYSGFDNPASIRYSTGNPINTWKDLGSRVIFYITSSTE